MKKFKEPNVVIRQFVDKNGSKVIIATYKYAGSIVKGKAKCNPEMEEFSEEKGIELATARCIEKLRLKQLRYKLKRIEEINRQLTELTHKYEKAEKEVYLMQEVLIGAEDIRKEIEFELSK